MCVVAHLKSSSMFWHTCAPVLNKVSDTHTHRYIYKAKATFLLLLLFFGHLQCASPLPLWLSLSLNSPLAYSGVIYETVSNGYACWFNLHLRLNARTTSHAQNWIIFPGKLDCSSSKDPTEQERERERSQVKARDISNMHVLCENQRRLIAQFLAPKQTRSFACPENQQLKQRTMLHSIDTLYLEHIAINIP